MLLSPLFGTRVGLCRRTLRSYVRRGWALLLLAAGPAGPVWAAVPPAMPPRPLAEALNPDGTLKAGLRGSFDPEGYALGTDSATGQPAFRPAATRHVLGAGDEHWQDGFGLNAPGMGLNGSVRALAVDGSGNVYAGGNFTTAGGTAANYVAKWDGTTWSPLGTGMNSSVYALAVDGSGNVYAGGNFTTAGGTAANRVAQWNGTTWSALGTGLNSSVVALAVDGSGNVYVGGIFTAAGGNAGADNVAKWNGTAWSTMGTGLSYGVRSLVVDGSGNVYTAGGYSGNLGRNRVDKWNGTTWSTLTTDWGAMSLAVDGSGNVYAGVSYTTARGGEANRVDKWNGTTWSTLGPNINGRTYALAVDGSGNVYAGGDFTTAGATAAKRIAKWNGTAWSVLGTGLNSSVAALAVRNGNVYAGGEFMAVGDGSKATARFGIYNPSAVLGAAPAALAALVALYPNPAGKAVFVALPAALRHQAATAELVDALGRVLLRQELPAGGAAHALPLGAVAPGVYALRLHTAVGTLTKRLVVE